MSVMLKPESERRVVYPTAADNYFEDRVKCPYLNPVVYLPPADKYHRLTHRLSQEQKDLDERALMASQRPSPPW
jgi:hypothetical protein